MFTVKFYQLFKCSGTFIKLKKKKKWYLQVTVLDLTRTKERAYPGPAAAVLPPGCAPTVTRRANPPGPGRSHSVNPPGGERGPEPGVRAGLAPPAPPGAPRSAHTARRAARGRPPGQGQRGVRTSARPPPLTAPGTRRRQLGPGAPHSHVVEAEQVVAREGPESGHRAATAPPPRRHRRSLLSATQRTPHRKLSGARQSRGGAGWETASGPRLA